MSEVRGALLKALLLTVRRRDKVLTINQAHLVDNIWLIRTEKREKGNAGTLVLPQVVIERAQMIGSFSTSVIHSLLI